MGCVALRCAGSLPRAALRCAALRSAALRYARRSAALRYATLRCAVYAYALTCPRTHTFVYINKCVHAVACNRKCVRVRQ